MTGLYSFLKGSTIIDLIAIALVLITSFGLIVTGISLLIWGKRKKLFYVLVVITFFPVIIAVADATFRMVIVERTLARVSELDESDVERFRSESRSDFLVMTSLGAVGTALPLLIGGCGLLFKKDSETLT